jgi:type VI secretion system protein ImpE
MLFQDLLESRQIEQARTALLNELKQSPSDVNRWVHLFAVECIMGLFQKALSRLQTAATLNEAWAMTAQENRMLIGCELARREVFSAKAKPLILGEPPAWVAAYVESLAQEAQKRPEEASKLRAAGWASAPEVRATVNGQPCEWLADADHRFGPILEGFLDGRYYWIPFVQIQSLRCEAPQSLVERVWLPAQVKLATGAELRAYLPVRYPGSEEAADPEIRLACRTQWRSAAGDGCFGLGERKFEHPQGYVPLLDCREIEFQGRKESAPAD